MCENKRDNRRAYRARMPGRRHAYIWGLCAALALTVAMAVIPIRAAATDENFMDSGCDSMKKLSASEIVKLLEDTAGTAPTDPGELYDEVPSFTNPYDTGIVKEIYPQKATDRLNALRAIAGVPAVTMDKNLNDSGQYGAVILGCLGVAFSHYPAQPQDMKDDFYEKAEAATRSSNIYAGRDLLATPDGFMNDSDARNVDRLGHRRWQLNPTMGKVGFGYVAGAPNTYKQYTAEMCHDRSASNNDYNFISWPPSGNFPNSLFGGNIAWSVSVNTSRYETINRANFRVVLTMEENETRNKRSWTFSDNAPEAPYTPAGAGTYYNIETSWYGINSCVIFRPDGIENYTGDWTVSLYGLRDARGEDADIHYRVSFFDPENPPEEAQETWPETNPDQALKTAEVTDVTIAEPDTNGARAVTVKAKSADGGNFLIALAAYDKDGKLLSSGARMADLTASDSETVFSLAGSADAKSVKAFLIDSNRRAPGSSVFKKDVPDASAQAMAVADFDLDSRETELLIPPLPEM